MLGEVKRPCYRFSMSDSALQTSDSAAEIFYPESDGEPMGENDRHRDWINIIIENLKDWFRSRPGDVYVTGDLFWYPVEGDPKTVRAPDTMIVFGREQYDLSLIHI